MATAASRSFGEGGVDGCGCRVVQKLPQIEEGKKEFCGQTLFSLFLSAPHAPERGCVEGISFCREDGREGRASCLPNAVLGPVIPTEVEMCLNIFSTVLSHDG